MNDPRLTALDDTPGGIGITVRVIQPGMHFGMWREDQYRYGTKERYRTLIIDLGIRRIEIRRRVA